jgi:hypothetical protein
MREAEEVEGVRRALHAPTPPLIGKPADRQQARLVRVKLEPEALEASLQLDSEPSRVGLPLEPSARSSVARRLRRYYEPVFPTRPIAPSRWVTWSLRIDRGRTAIFRDAIQW